MSDIFSKKSIDDNEKNSLVEVTNFIGQEAYRLAVIKQYPEDYSRIVNLYKSVVLKFSKYNQNDIFRFDDLMFNVVDFIALGFERESFSLRITDLLNEIYSVEYTLEVNVLSEVYDLVMEIFDENMGAEWNLFHKYPPHILATSFNYHQALEYFYNRMFTMTSEKIDLTDDKDMMDFLQADSVIQLNITPPPYTSVRPYEKPPIYKISCGLKEVQISSHALSKNQHVPRTIVAGPDVIESWSDLRWLRKEDYFDMITELNFKLDMSENITDEELDLILTRLRIKISNAQHSNRNGKLLSAETQIDLISAYRTPELTKPDYTSLMEMNKVKIKGLDSAENAKDIICGLILMSNYFVTIEDVNGLESIQWKADSGKKILSGHREMLANELLEKYRNRKLRCKDTREDGALDYLGFSSGMIERGYKKLKKLMKHHIDAFQYHRVQFDENFNAVQRKTLNSEESVRLEFLHRDDRPRVEVEIEKHAKQGRAAAVKTRANGSFVISW